jgi:hypothetical protein
MAYGPCNLDASTGSASSAHHSYASHSSLQIAISGHDKQIDNGDHGEEAVDGGHRDDDDDDSGP